MISLPNGCRCGPLTVFPKNWNKRGASVKTLWYIRYRFYDPRFKDKYPYGKERKIKGDVNKFTDLNARRDAMESLLNEELLLLYDGMNIIDINKSMIVRDESEISPYTTFISALEQALKRLTIRNETKLDMKSCLKYIEIAANKFYFNRIPVNEIKKKHIKLVLDEQVNIKLTDKEGKQTPRKWTNERYNVYWKHLHRLFRELIELDACEYNPVSMISKKSVTHKMQQVLTKKERNDAINVYLKDKFYNFYRFCQIFFHSGGRIAELLRIQTSTVDLERQRYKIIVVKGKNSREEERTIKDVALPFWKELLNGAKPKDYIFSKDLVPGPVAITAPQITRRWKTHVKDKLGITASLYSLKHSNLDETAAILDYKAAQKQAGHTTPVITIDRYLHGEKDRLHQRLKGVDNEL